MQDVLGCRDTIIKSESSAASGASATTLPQDSAKQARLTPGVRREADAVRPPAAVQGEPLKGSRSSGMVLQQRRRLARAKCDAATAHAR